LPASLPDNQTCLNESLRDLTAIVQNSAMNFECTNRLLSVFRGLLLLLFLIPLHSHAQTPLYSTLDDFLRAQTQGLPGKVSFSISPLDTRTQLPPCSAYEPFLPPGSKLWGKTTVGVRCLAPSTWTVYAQVQVTVVGNYLVATRSIPAGSVLATSDLNSRSGDLSRLPSSVLTDQTQAVGKTAKNGLFAGQPLRSDQLITAWAVQQGQSVKTVSNGPGFSVSSEGKALNNALEGQVVQVRTGSGQIVSGIARAGGIVEVSH
jgi:flagellar basal body P-ring formation protein FlgA